MATSFLMALNSKLQGLFNNFYIKNKGDGKNESSIDYWS